MNCDAPPVNTAKYTSDLLDWALEKAYKLDDRLNRSNDIEQLHPPIDNTRSMMKWRRLSRSSTAELSVNCIPDWSSILATIDPSMDVAVNGEVKVLKGISMDGKSSSSGSECEYQLMSVQVNPTNSVEVDQMTIMPVSDIFTSYFRDEVGSPML